MKNNTGLLPQEDELLQSYILRTLSMIGEGDFRLLFFDGQWRGWRIIKSDYFSFYEKTGIYHLARLYYELCSVYAPFDFVSNRFNWSTFDAKVFFSDRKNERSGPFLRIIYCKHCVDKQLNDMGFSYFKLSWYRRSICEVHNEKLNELPSWLNSRKTLYYVRSILRGDWLSLKSIELVSEKKVVNPYIQHPGKNFSIAPCAQRDLVSYFYHTLSYYPDGFNTPAIYGALSKSDSDILTSYSYKKHIEKNLNAIYARKYYSLEHPDKYIAERFVPLEFSYFGINHELMKSKSKNCSTCIKDNISDYDACPFNIHISKFNRVFKLKFGICEDYISSLDDKVYLFQERLGVFKGEKFVYKSIDNVKYIERKYGSIDNYNKVMEGKMMAASRFLWMGGELPPENQK